MYYIIAKDTHTQIFILNCYILFIAINNIIENRARIKNKKKKTFLMEFNNSLVRLG